MSKYANDRLLNLMESNFGINFKVEEINNELVFKIGNEKISIYLKDETDNDYLLFDYMLKFWTLSDDFKHSRGDHIAIHKGEDFEKTIADFLDEKVFQCTVFRKNFFMNEIRKPRILETHDAVEPKPIVITVADNESEKKEEPLTLFDFM